MEQRNSEVRENQSWANKPDVLAERTMDLLREAKNCADSRQVKRIHDQIVLEHISIARSLARRYFNRGVELDDLNQIASMGLVKAVAGCDPDRCEVFLQYAVPTIMGELKRHFRDKSWTVRPTRRIQELHAAVTAARTDLTHALGREPSELELATATGSDEASVREAIEASRYLRAESLDAALDAGTPMSNATSSDLEQQVQVETALALNPAVSGLSDRERVILQRRFFDGYTQSEIGLELGLSQMHVSRLLRDILAKLRAELEGAELVAV